MYPFHWCFHLTVAENTRILKELSSDVKHNAEAIKQLYNVVHEQIDQLEVSNAACFEAMQMNTESKVSQINTALYMLLNQIPQNCALLARAVNCT
jgi:uncharacterized protein YukE